MMQKNRMLALLVGVSLASVAMAADDVKKAGADAQSGVKVAVDNDGKVRQFTAEDEKALNLNKGETVNLLSKRLNAPKVTVVRKLKAGATMAEIGLDQVDYLVVKTDEAGVPTVMHRSNEQTITASKAEEK